MSKLLASGWYGDSVAWQLIFFMILLASASFSVAISQIALGVALLAMLWRWAKRGEAPPRTGVEVAAAWLALWALAMIPFSADPDQSLLFYRRFYLFTALWVGCSLSTNDRHRIGLMLALLIGAMGISLYGEVMVVREVGGLFVQRIMGTSNSMTSGALLMIVLLLVLGYAAAGGLRRKWQVALLVAVSPVALSLLQTMTRSALLGFVCGVGAMVLLAKPRRFLIFLGACVLMVVVILGFGESFLPAYLWARINPEYIANGFNTSARLEMWQGGLAMIKANPLTGVGDCDLTALVPAYYGDENTVYFGHLHNNQIMQGVIWGVPGLILAQLFLIVPLVLLVKRWRALAGDTVARAANPALAGWILGAVGVWCGFYVAGFTEWYFGDAEPMVMYLAVLGIALGGKTATSST